VTFNRECEYALLGMAALATEGSGRPLMLSEIAVREELPLSFLSKIFQKLLKHGLVVSHRGVERGYTLAREARAVPLRTILEAIEGPDLFERCVFSHRPCAGEENPCLMHKAWQDVRPQVQAAFENTTLQDVVEARKATSPAPAAARRARARHA
jgi:Rrf2 family protein